MKAGINNSNKVKFDYYIGEKYNILYFKVESNNNYLDNCLYLSIYIGSILGFAIALSIEKNK